MDNRLILACLFAALGIVVLVLGVVLSRRARYSPSGIRKKLQMAGMKILIEKCPYCGTDYPIRDDIERCPRCGGDLKLHRSALARNEKKFSMDGKDDTGVS
jgi:rRNA maturation protein Nop10